MEGSAGPMTAKSEFIKHLRATAEELKPLTQSALPNSVTWDGIRYVKEGEVKAPDPYALAWWSVLKAMAGLIESQESALSAKQVAYLHKELFGGMGSLNDLFFADAAELNARLNQARANLFSSLSALQA